MNDQHMGGIFLLELPEQGLPGPSRAAAIALDTQEVSAPGPSIRLNDDSGDRRGHRA